MDSSAARTFLAIALSMAVILLWQMYIAKTHPVRATDAGVVDTGVESLVDSRNSENSGSPSSEDTEDNSVKAGADITEKKVDFEEKLAVIKNDLVEATFTNRGGRLKGLILKKYRERHKKEENVNLVYKDALPLITMLNNPSYRFSENDGYEIMENSDNRILMRYEHPSGIVIFKEYKIEKDYEFILNVTVKNNTDKEFSFKPAIIWTDSALKGGLGEEDLKNSLGEHYYPSCLANNTILGGENIYKERISQKAEGQIGWISSNSRYFITSIIPVNQKMALCKFTSDSNYNYSVSLTYPEQKTPLRGETLFSYKMYLGPKGYSLLKGMGVELERAVDFGWLAVLCIPLLYLLNFFDSIVHNYGIAIILLTIIIKLISIPFTQKSMKSMQELQKLKPKLDELQKKYKDDKEKLNEEMMKLYREYGVSPFGGCLPMLLQMPIWFALYRMLSNSVELYQAAFIPHWIDDLSAKDPYYILPVLLGVGTFLQQKLTPSTMDSTQAKVMLYFMPIFLTFIMISLPSGLTLYIFVSSLLSIIHQIYMNRTNSSINNQTKTLREEKK